MLWERVRARRERAKVHASIRNGKCVFVCMSGGGLENDRKVMERGMERASGSEREREKQRERERKEEDTIKKE